MIGFLAEGAAAVTPNDNTELGPCKALYIGGAGNVSVWMPGREASVTFFAVPAGTVLPVSARRVLQTGTNATNIVALT